MDNPEHSMPSDGSVAEVAWEPSGELAAPSSSEDTSGSDECGAEKGRNGAWTTAGIIVADVVGAGILGMPTAIAQFGWLLGAIMMAVMLAANVHISLLMWQVRQGVAESGIRVRSYIGLTRRAFGNAPKWQRRSIVAATSFSQMSFLFGLMALYLMSAGKGFGMAFYELEICLPRWAAIAAGVMLPFAVTAREMGTYKSLVWINIITLCGTVLIPLVYYTVVGADAIRPPGAEIVAVAPLTPASTLSALSTFTFGMTSQFMLVEIITEMRDPTELPKAYARLSAPFQFGAFLTAGTGGYFFLGSKASGMLNENLPFQPVIRAAAGCLVTHMLISYLIKNVVFCQTIHKIVDGEYSDPADGRLRARTGWMIVVCVTLALAWLLANLVPFFGDAVDLLGASFTPLSCWVIPILMYVRWRYDAGDSAPAIGVLSWVALFLEMALALVLMVLGTASAVNHLRANWATYGYPFECHCEGIRDTCECSAGHVGMQDLCAAFLGNASSFQP